jgi:hypothetical protein
MEPCRGRQCACDVLRRLSERARLQLGLFEVGPVVLNARANAVKGRKAAA